MANIAVLVPTDEMAEQMKQAAAARGVEIKHIKTVKTIDALQEARNMVSDGANIIIARGLQAKLIKSVTNIPLVEIRNTSQELAMLVMKAKKIIKKDKIHIAVIGFDSAYGSMKHFEELYDIKLTTYFVNEVDELHIAVNSAIRDSADIIIGGEKVLESAEYLGIPAIFNDSSEESMLEALFIAERMCYAIDIEKQTSAQIDSLLETSLDGIIRVDTLGRITAINQIVQDVTEKTGNELIGKKIDEIIDEDSSFMDVILGGEKKNSIITINYNEKHLRLTCAPIEIGNKILGAIITIHQMGLVTKNTATSTHVMFLNGFVATHNFSQIQRKSSNMTKCIETAKTYAVMRNPVLIYGESGTETEQIAQCIHNKSSRRNQPFVSINCFETGEEKQAEMLFGTDNETNMGALLSANYGTIHISDIQNLNLQCQYRLFRLINQGILIRNDINKAMNVDVRIIVSTSENLVLYAQRGDFRKDLYYLLQTFSIKIPPLRDTKDDIKRLTEMYVQKSIEKYLKYIILSDDAMKKIQNYSWEGNISQLGHFCELLVLTAQKRTIHEGYVSNLLSELYPIMETSGGSNIIKVYQNPEALTISDALSKHAGNRSKVANELGISTTTLWRRMKKYGLGS